MNESHLPLRAYAVRLSLKQKYIIKLALYYKIVLD